MGVPGSDSFWMWVESLQRSMGTREGHLGTDNGAHHILPGWGKHPDTFEEAPVGQDLEQAHIEGNRPKAWIGSTTIGDHRVYFDPDLPQAHLANAHMTITGESGSGKTQAMKTILADLSYYAIPALVLDFKDDYAEKNYAAKEHFSVYDPTQRPLPFNPLEPPVDPQTGKSNKTFHTYQLTEILGRIYHLGELQQHALREAIMACYVASGDALPTFDQVKAELEKGKGNGELLGHLAPIFDFGFFADPDPAGFAQIASGNTVIRLAQLPGSEVKNSVAEFFLMALYNYLVRLEQTYLLRQVLVLDEAWRVVNSPFLEPLMREARAFGLGVFVATQFPTDLPLAVSGSAATSLYFSQSNPDQVTEVERAISGTTSGSEAMRIGTTVRSMLPLQAIVHNKQYEPFAITNARPYYARGHEDDAKVAAAMDAAVVDSSPMAELPRSSGSANFNQTKGSKHSERVAQEVPPKDDGLFICSRCGTGTTSTDGTCADCKDFVNTFKSDQTLQQRIDQRVNQAEHNGMEPAIYWNAGGKTAEMQKFPPGEDDDENSTWAPFSMSEWQMVKGPKKRSGAAAMEWKPGNPEYDAADWDNPAYENEGKYRFSTHPGHNEWDDDAVAEWSFDEKGQDPDDPKTPKFNCTHCGMIVPGPADAKECPNCEQPWDDKDVAKCAVHGDSLWDHNSFPQRCNIGESLSNGGVLPGDKILSCPNKREPTVEDRATAAAHGYDLSHSLDGKGLLHDKWENVLSTGGRYVHDLYKCPTCQSKGWLRDPSNPPIPKEWMQPCRFNDEDLSDAAKFTKGQGELRIPQPVEKQPSKIRNDPTTS